GVVLGVLLEVAVRARLGDRGDHRRPLHRAQLLELLAQALGPGGGQGGDAHAPSSSCSSCSDHTRGSWRVSIALISARAPGTVVEYVTRCCSASRRIEKESAISCFPSVVLMM